MGMGLAISKMIIDKMGGQIDLASKVGEGTTFTFSIKVSPPAEGGGYDTTNYISERPSFLDIKMARLQEQEKKFLGKEGERSNRQVLIVDDNSYNLFVLKELITIVDPGCEVVEA